MTALPKFSSQSGKGSVEIMGIDFGGFSKLIAKAMILIKKVLEANANTGIGIGFSIRFVSEHCFEKGVFKEIRGRTPLKIFLVLNFMYMPRFARPVFAYLPPTSLGMEMGERLSFLNTKIVFPMSTGLKD